MAWSFNVGAIHSHLTTLKPNSFFPGVAPPAPPLPWCKHTAWNYASLYLGLFTQLQSTAICYFYYADLVRPSSQSLFSHYQYISLKIYFSWGIASIFTINAFLVSLLFFYSAVPLLWALHTIFFIIKFTFLHNSSMLKEK